MPGSPMVPVARVIEAMLPPLTADEVRASLAPECRAAFDRLPPEWQRQVVARHHATRATLAAPFDSEADPPTPTL